MSTFISALGGKAAARLDLKVRAPLSLMRLRRSQLSGPGYAATTTRKPRELLWHSDVASKFRPHRKTSRNNSALARRYAEHAEPLRSACKAPTKIVKRPRPDSRSDLSLRATVVAERTIRAIEHNLPVLGKVSNTRRIIGIIGMSCGTPFLVRSPGNSTASAVISPRANSVISLRRVPVKISSSISAPVAPPWRRPLPK